MSADLLREAAADMRDQYDDAEDGGPDPFIFAVAAWLDACASVLEAKPSAAKAHAVTVARAYLRSAA